MYLEPTIKYKKFKDIESEIVKQWKKNPLLVAIETFWFNSVMKYPFKNLEEF